MLANKSGRDVPSATKVMAVMGTSMPIVHLGGSRGAGGGGGGAGTTARRRGAAGRRGEEGRGTRRTDGENGIRVCVCMT
jgi:hypothetical protein